jgi:dienelactone hydrolase
LLALSMAACSGSEGAAAPAHVTIAVTPASASLDAPVAVTVHGLTKGTRVDMIADAQDRNGDAWRATARFVADAHGEVSLGQPSIDGSYVGINPMGLIELMRPVGDSTATTLLVKRDGDYAVTFTARVGGRAVATASAIRLNPLANGVSSHVEKNDGLYGVMFEPRPTPTRRPGILLLGGSEGGLPSAFSGAILAGAGYPTLALAYFDGPGLPGTLRNVPVEYFGKALRLLAKHPDVDASRIVVWGVSRGSEAALLTGIHYPRLVHAVIAGSPSSVVNGSYPGGGAAWTLKGTPLPRFPDPAATLEVEKILGPVVTICGALDAVWAACQYSQAIAGRRVAHHVPYQDLNLSYPEAGHSVGNAACYFSTTSTSVTTVSGSRLGVGGTIEANAKASAAAHTKVLAFLTSLG